jgi:hypothetical protein
MATSQRTILDVLFPRVRAKLLQLLFTAPVKQRYVRELALMSRLDLHTVHDELRKLSAAGLLTSWSNGYYRFYQPNREHPLYLELRHVVEVSGNLAHPGNGKLSRARGRGAKRSVSRKPPPLPRDYPIKWHLFSQRIDGRRL